MSKYNERIKARQLRKNGVSIVVIASMLGVTKSSVSAWCRDITLTPEQNFKLVKNKGVSVTTGQRMGAEANKKMRLNAIRDAELYGQEMVKKISNRELLLIATALYWSEGSKSSRTSGFVFVNSDPEMIRVMRLFLIDVLKIPKKDLVCSIQINKIHEGRIEKVLSFWKKLLQLPRNQFRKPYYVNTRVTKVYDNYDDYHGVCRLVVRRGMNLKYRMIGLIKAMKEDILSA
jgi:plasmid maintenance system antidote protein VapI